ncbi:hypothetical protein [Patulibacter defluvii]|uniref:hypothetical protein n=1 Tax=Patulibacter defluvii TaxID=3095358 RepID=UPI002A760787|nr:hypothetical protein [Patulibacter sp. DM4]
MGFAIAAHVSGLPVEETLAAFAPALTVGIGVLGMAARQRIGLALRRLRRSPR